MNATAPPQYVLPKVPSQLIRIALEDIEACETDPRIRFDMDGCYHVPEGDLCYVCAAGAVMHRRLYAPVDADMDPDRFPQNVAQLDAIDHLRTGQIGRAFDRLRLDSEGIYDVYDRPIANYETSPLAFKADMRSLADDLEAAGY